MPFLKNTVWIKNLFAMYQKSKVPILLAVFPGILAAIASRYAILLTAIYNSWCLQQDKKLQMALELTGMPDVVSVFQWLLTVAIILWLITMLLGFIRKAWALSLIRISYITIYLIVFFAAYLIFSISAVAFQNNLMLDGNLADSVILFYWRFEKLKYLLLISLITTILHIVSYKRVCINFYSLSSELSPAQGDLILENIRTHGNDPRFRKSLLLSFLLHFLIIIVLPLCLRMLGHVEPYTVPYGSGDPVVSIIKVMPPPSQQQRKKPRHLVVNPKSTISFYKPDLDDSKIIEEVGEETKLTYQADVANAHSRLGVGGGSEGGWPDGMKDAVVRFIRLEYDGDGWNDGMDEISAADINFLAAFQKETGFKTAKKSESHPIYKLAKYPKGYAPPFVYMTGSGSIRVGKRDMEILRNYLMDGGMLFADAGSPEFDRNFRTFIQQVLPGQSLVVIADDDPIYQRPFVFPNGAPPLWHHGGSKALGIKIGDRWAVYYHPGDMNDAWKTGHSGVDPQLAKNAMRLGINVVYHAFTHYLERTKKYRK
jgi:hypothetical protein